jgi:hypothetical protein
VNGTAAQRVRWGGLGAAGLGTLACIVGLAAGAAGAFFWAYLVAYAFWLGLALGSLVLLMLQYLTGGAWSVVIRRILEAGTRTLPLLAVLFVPLLFGLPHLYEWARLPLPEGLAGALDAVGLLGTYHSLWPPRTTADPVLEHKSLYLNVPFSLLRAAVYFAVWLTLAHFLNRWSQRDDEAGRVLHPRRYRLLSAPGLALYGLTATFAAIDWLMSLEPHWYSTVYGVLVMVGQVLSGLVFAVVVLALVSDRPPLAGVVRPGHLRDLGSLLLAFVMLWAYIAFSQYLLIWAGNLPEEIPWYLRRTAHGWGAVAGVLILLHFALPFLMLLSGDVRRSRPALAAVAGLILVMRLVEVAWLILPACHALEDAAALGWLTPAAVLAVGGLWVALFAWELGKRPLLPVHEPDDVEVSNHG